MSPSRSGGLVPRLNCWRGSSGLLGRLAGTWGCWALGVSPDEGYWGCCRGVWGLVIGPSHNPPVPPCRRLGLPGRSHNGAAVGRANRLACRLWGLWDLRVRRANPVMGPSQGLSGGRGGLWGGGGYRTCLFRTLKTPYRPLVTGPWPLVTGPWGSRTGSHRPYRLPSLRGNPYADLDIGRSVSYTLSGRPLSDPSESICTVWSICIMCVICGNGVMWDDSKVCVGCKVRASGGVVTSNDGRTVYAVWEGPVEDRDSVKREKWAALAHWAKYAGRKARKKYADRVTYADCTGRTASAAWVG